MKVYVLRADEEDSQHPVKVYSSVEDAVRDNPGEYGKWYGNNVSIAKLSNSYGNRYFQLEEFEVE